MTVNKKTQRFYYICFDDFDKSQHLFLVNIAIENVLRLCYNCLKEILYFKFRFDYRFSENLHKRGLTE